MTWQRMGGKGRREIRKRKGKIKKKRDGKQRDCERRTEN